MIDGSTRVFAILGDPVAHSLSPLMHNAAFTALGTRAAYVPLQCSAEDLGPLIQGLAPLRMRALWAAVTLLVINLVGLGLGPTAIGVISDLLRPAFGEDSLRYAMLTFAAATPWALWHYWRAGQLLKRAGS